jgi:hypothetical protein
VSIEQDAAVGDQSLEDQHANEDATGGALHERAVLQSLGSDGVARETEQQLERERVARETEQQLERERVARETEQQLERERVARETEQQLERERVAQETELQLERERVARETEQQLERERVARETEQQLERERVAQETEQQLERERVAQETELQLERERVETEQQLWRERVARETEQQHERERVAWETEQQRERERVALEREHWEAEFLGPWQEDVLFQMTDEAIRMRVHQVTQAYNCTLAQLQGFRPPDAVCSLQERLRVLQLTFNRLSHEQSVRSNPVTLKARQICRLKRLLEKIGFTVPVRATTVCLRKMSKDAFLYVHPNKVGSGNRQVYEDLVGLRNVLGLR